MACNPTPAERLEIEKMRNDSIAEVREQQRLDSIATEVNGLRMKAYNDSLEEVRETLEIMAADTNKGAIQNLLEQFTDSTELFSP